MSSSFPAAEPRATDVVLVDEASGSGTVGAIVVGLLLTSIGGALAIGSGGGYFGLVLCFFGLITLVGGGRKLLAGSKFEAPSVTLSVSPQLLGESFHGELMQRVKSDAEINSVSVTLICREWVQYRQGTKTRTATHDVHSVKIVLDSASHVSPPDCIRGNFEFQIPEDAMHSFTASDNRIYWLIEVHTDVANWPDYTSSIKLSVAAQTVNGEDN